MGSQLIQIRAGMTFLGRLIPLQRIASVPHHVPQTFRSLRVRKAALVSLFVMGQVFWGACKQPLGGGKSPPLTESQLKHAEGFPLQDSNGISGSLVRVVQGQSIHAPTLAQGFLTSASSALVTGTDCVEGASLVFPKQGDGVPLNASDIDGEVRQITDCQRLVEQLREGEETLLKMELMRFLAQNSDLKIAQVKFTGGLPEVDAPRWKAVPPHVSLAMDTRESAWKSWMNLEGKFVYLAGFNRELQTVTGAAARRYWLPYRLKSDPLADFAFLFALEANFEEGERSPLSSKESWEKGPSEHFFPALAFSGGAKYPTVFPYAGLQVDEPRALCFVYSWFEKKEGPLPLRYTPRCLDASVVMAAFQD